MKQLLTTKDLEEIFQVTRFTLNNWREKGLPVIKIAGNIRYDIDEVKKWVDDQNEGAKNNEQ